MSRDPIGERGGGNQFAYVANSPCRLWDFLGLAWRGATYAGDDYYWQYQIRWRSPGTMGRVVGGFAGGTATYTINERRDPEIVKVVKDGQCQYCIKDNTGVWDVSWRYWGVKGAVPTVPAELPDRQRYVVDWNWIRPNAGFVAHARWHEETELKLLQQLFHVTVETAEARAKEYWCKSGKLAASPEALSEYVRWQRAVDTYNAQVRSGSPFDDRFGITIRNGEWVPVNDRSLFRMSEFDGWYKPDIWEP